MVVSHLLVKWQLGVVGNSPNYYMASDITCDQEIVFYIRSNATYCVRVLGVSLHCICVCINDKQFTICQTSKGYMMAIIEEFNWKWIRFQASIIELHVLYRILIYSWYWLLFLYCALERYFIWAWLCSMPFIHQHFSIFSYKN